MQVGNTFIRIYHSQSRANSVASVNIGFNFFDHGSFDRRVGATQNSYRSSLATCSVHLPSKGFMLPGVDFEGITDFHMVRSLWGCCFGAPPRVNELILVRTPGGEGLRYTYNTLEIVGKVEVKFELLDGLIEDLYRMQAESIIEGDFDDPRAPEGATAADLGDFLPEMEF